MGLNSCMERCYRANIKISGLQSELGLGAGGGVLGYVAYE